MEDEEGMELAKTAMEELGEEMGADPELMARITALSRKTGKKDRVCHEFQTLKYQIIHTQTEIPKSFFILDPKTRVKTIIGTKHWALSSALGTRYMILDLAQSSKHRML